MMMKTKIKKHGMEIRHSKCNKIILILVVNKESSLQRSCFFSHVSLFSALFSLRCIITVLPECEKAYLLISIHSVYSDDF